MTFCALAWSCSEQTSNLLFKGNTSGAGVPKLLPASDWPASVISLAQAEFFNLLNLHPRTVGTKYPGTLLAVSFMGHIQEGSRASRCINGRFYQLGKGQVFVLRNRIF